MSRHKEMVEAYHAARDVHAAAREHAAIGYATETADYNRDNPPPRLADFMRGSGSGYPEGVCSHGFYNKDCYHDHSEGEL